MFYTISFFQNVPKENGMISNPFNNQMRGGWNFLLTSSGPILIFCVANNWCIHVYSQTIRSCEDPTLGFVKSCEIPKVSEFHVISFCDTLQAEFLIVFPGCCRVNRATHTSFLGNCGKSMQNPKNYSRPYHFSMDSIIFQGSADQFMDAGYMNIQASVVY